MVTVAHMRGRAVVVGLLLLVGVAGGIWFGVGTRSSPSTGESFTQNPLHVAAATCPDRATAYVAHTECLGEIIYALINSRGADAAVAIIHEYLAGDPIAISACHSAVHISGRQMVDPESVKTLIAADDGSCNFGLTHGALEGFALHVDEVEFGRLAASMCTHATPGILRYNCAHGIGHALALRYGGTLDHLVRRCTSLHELDQEGCVTAMSMAYTNDNASLADDVRIVVPRLEDTALSSVCAGIGGVVEATCWQMAPHWYSRLPLDRLSTLVGAACTEAGEYLTKCANGLGQALFFRSEPPPDVDPASIEHAFEHALPRCPAGILRVECVAGIVGGAAAWWAETHDDFTEYPMLCATLSLEEAAMCRSVEDFWYTQLDELGRGD